MHLNKTFNFKKIESLLGKSKKFINDNGVITFLSTLVPDFTDNLKYAVVAGAVAGGGLTVIANAPNPAGQSILKKYFENGVSPAGLFKAAIVPTLIVWLCYLIFG